MSESKGKVTAKTVKNSSKFVVENSSKFVVDGKLVIREEDISYIDGRGVKTSNGGTNYWVYHKGTKEKLKCSPDDLIII